MNKKYINVILNKCKYSTKRKSDLIRHLKNHNNK